MRADFAPRLRCPVCRREKSLRIEVAEQDEREVREGELRCSACGSVFPVHRGVPELLHDAPEHIRAEAAGLERFAEYMRASGWDREKVMSLPYVQDGYWYVQARSMHQLLTTVPFRPGQSVLDIGSNTCWATNEFARKGLRAVALDIATTELQGLYTADWFIEGGEVFFERVLGSMDAIPLSSSSVDYVYCCEVLHHNDEESLRRTFAEIFRVLRPGGRLLMVNETLKTLRDRHGVHVDAVEQFEGYEHAHWALRYRWEATRAGFFTEVTEPHYRPFFGDVHPTRLEGEAPLRWWLHRHLFYTHSRGVARRAYLWWLNNAWGGVSMNLVGTKPTRFVGRHAGMPTWQRLLRSAAAGLRVTLARAARRGPPRLPRTPEQAAQRMHWWAEPAEAREAGGGGSRGSRRRSARSG